jgi:hypothetical protein
MLRGRRAALATGLAIAAAAAVTAGCGSGGRAQALSLDPVSAAATKTQNAGAARVRFSLALSSPHLAQGKSVAVRGTGAIDGTSSELTIGVGAFLHDAGLPMGTSGSVKEIFLEQNGDYVLYLKSGLAAYLPGGKQWVELDLSKLGKSAGLDLEQLMSGSQLQPGDLLSMLKAEGAKVHTVGAATVDGTATTHYLVTIDVAKALQGRGIPSAFLANAAKQLPATIPASVWIGKDGLVRRIKVSYAVARTHAAMKMDLYDYGAHVTIAAPPTGSVFDATQLAQSGIGSFTH